MPYSHHIFRSYNIRGLLHEVTPEVARVAAHALLAITQAKKVVVGRDMRETSPDLAQAAIAFFLEHGVDVVDIGMCTSSMYNFAVTAHNDVDAGMMMTASHNPAEYNGIKTALHNGLPVAGAELLAHAHDALPQNTSLGTLVEQDVLPEYLAQCLTLAHVPDVRGIKIVIDYGNGMGALSLRPLCARLGIEVVELYAEPDAHFPNHEANPAKEETLTDLKAKVREVGAAFGVATDGDADRIVFVDNEGKVILGDWVLALLAQDRLKAHPGGKVLYSVNEGWVVEDTVRASGGEPVMCPVGNTKIIRMMHDLGGMIGGETSSHFFFPEFAHLETIDYVFLLILGMWKRSEKTFAELFAPMRVYASSGEMNFTISDKPAAMAALDALFAPLATARITLDGVRYEHHRLWWLLVRESNTEPLLRVTIEGKSAEDVEEKKRQVIEVLAPFYA